MNDHLKPSGHAKRTLKAFIEREYGAEAGTVWERTMAQYQKLFQKAPDYGGRKSPHAKQIADAILLLAFCSTAPREHSIEELEPVSYEIFMSAFHTLGKLFSARNQWTMNLLGVVFKSAIEKDNRHALKFPADFTGTVAPYDKENGIVRYCFTRCPLADFVKANGLGKWMPLMCNCDHTGLRAIHAGLIREGTCFTGDCCDYCIVSDENPLYAQYTLSRNADGLFLSIEKGKENRNNEQ